MKAVAIASLVLGIIGFLFSFAFALGLLLSGLAVILGLLSLREKSMRGVAITGLILGILGIFIFFAWISGF
jgi:hypothetical protein